MGSSEVLHNKVVFPKNIKSYTYFNKPIVNIFIFLFLL